MSKENKESIEEVQKAYLYLVKTPSSNDLAVCACDNVLYPGTYVVSPTRYGLDMGLVVGTASNFDMGSNYVPGCKSCRGACHFGRSERSSEDDQRLVAAGFIEGNDIIWEKDDKSLENMGSLPSFEFKKVRVDKIYPRDPDGYDSANWDPAYKKPELVEVDGDVTWISHIASPEEITRYTENLEEEKEAIKICREKIAKHNLDMKLVTSHFLLCEPKVLFFFTAEDRVDFRDLVKDLVSVFRMRIELRQIGVRDESRVLGGLAVCGRDFCCHCVSDKLNPVTIKMAKEQNLSLNSMKISGPCGRLLCCLSYEYDFYCEEKLAYPTEGSKVKLGGEFFKVTEINILSRKMTVSGAEGRTFQIPRRELYYNHEHNRWEVSQRFQEEFLSN